MFFNILNFLNMKETSKILSKSLLKYLLNSSINSNILSSNFSLYFKVDFLQTKLYLLVQASILVLSM